MRLSSLSKGKEKKGEKKEGKERRGKERKGKEMRGEESRCGLGLTRDVPTNEMFLSHVGGFVCRRMPHRPSSPAERKVS